MNLGIGAITGYASSSKNNINNRNMNKIILRARMWWYVKASSFNNLGFKNSQNVARLLAEWTFG